MEKQKRIIVHSHFNPPKNSGERKADDRPLFVMRNKNGKELYPSEKVVPNKALKVKDIIDRFTRGLPVEETHGSKPVWPKDDMSHESPDYGKVASMDKMDSIDMSRSMRVTRRKAVSVPPKKDENPPKTE